jgi:hypothetical protein
MRSECSIHAATLRFVQPLKKFLAYAAARSVGAHARQPLDARYAPADMTNEQLEIAMTPCKRQLALWGHSEEKRSGDIEPAEIEEPVSD